jgi:hypothetical protein
MNIGKYCIDITEFELRPWIRVELEYEENSEERGYAYVYRGWLWFVVSYKEGFGWEQFQEKVHDMVDDDNDIFKL